MRTLAEVDSQRETVKLRKRTLSAQIQQLTHDEDHPHLVEKELQKLYDKSGDLQQQLRLIEAAIELLLRKKDVVWLQSERDRLCDEVETCNEQLQLLNAEHNKIVTDRQLLDQNSDDVKKLVSMAKKLPAEQMQELLTSLLNGAANVETTVTNASGTAEA